MTGGISDYETKESHDGTNSLALDSVASSLYIDDSPRSTHTGSCSPNIVPRKNPLARRVGGMEEGGFSSSMEGRARSDSIDSGMTGESGFRSPRSELGAAAVPDEEREQTYHKG